MSAAAASLCQDSKDASSAQTLAWIGYGAAAALATTGIVLLVTRSHDTPSNSSSSGRIDVTPTVSQRSGGVQPRIAF